MVFHLAGAGLALLFAVVDAQAFAAFGAIDKTGKQAATIGTQGNLAVLVELAAAFLDDFDGSIEVVVIHDAQSLNRLGKGVAQVHLATVDGIANHGANGCSSPEGGSLLGLYAALVEPVGKAVSAVTLVHDFVVAFRLDRSFFLVANQVLDGLVFLVHAAKIHGVKAEGYEAATVFASQYHLLVLRPDADGSLFRFAGSLPEADVVEQLINVAVETLLAFLDAPYPDTVGNEPLHHEGRFIIAASKAVKHEYQRHIELASQGIRLNLHDSVALISFHLVARYTFLVELLNDFPVWLGVNEFPLGPAQIPDRQCAAWGCHRDRPVLRSKRGIACTLEPLSLSFLNGCYLEND